LHDHVIHPSVGTRWTAARTPHSRCLRRRPHGSRATCTLQPPDGQARLGRLTTPRNAHLRTPPGRGHHHLPSHRGPHHPGPRPTSPLFHPALQPAHELTARTHHGTPRHDHRRAGPGPSGVGGVTRQ